jgi:hypothetical protein
VEEEEVHHGGALDFSRIITKTLVHAILVEVDGGGVHHHIIIIIKGIIVLDSSGLPTLRPLEVLSQPPHRFTTTSGPDSTVGEEAIS